MLIAPVESIAGGEISADRGVTATKAFVEEHGAALLQVMRLAAGNAGVASTQSLLGLFRTPGEPGRQEVAEAVRELQAALAEVPAEVEARGPAVQGDHIAELDAAVRWHLARICELAGRLA